MERRKTGARSGKLETKVENQGDSVGLEVEPGDPRTKAEIFLGRAGGSVDNSKTEEMEEPIGFKGDQAKPQAQKYAVEPGGQ